LSVKPNGTLPTGVAQGASAGMKNVIKRRGGRM
jgi:hypothetical protein